MKNKELSFEDRKREYIQLQKIIEGIITDTEAINIREKEEFLGFLEVSLMNSTAVKKLVVDSFYSRGNINMLRDEVYSIIGLYIASELKQDFENYDIEKASLKTHFARRVVYFALNVLGDEPVKSRIHLFDSWLNDKAEKDKSFLKGHSNFISLLSTKKDVKGTIKKYYIEFLKRREYKNTPKENIGERINRNSKYVNILHNYYTNNSQYKSNSISSTDLTEDLDRQALNNSYHNSSLVDSYFNIDSEDLEVKIGKQKAKVVIQEYLSNNYNENDNFSSYHNPKVLEKASGIFAMRLSNPDIENKVLGNKFSVGERRIRGYIKEFGDMCNIIGFRKVTQLFAEAEDQVRDKEKTKAIKNPKKR